MKINPFGDRKYLPSVFTVRCPDCNHVLNIRTKEASHTEPCWQCPNQFKVVLGMGKNNFSVYILRPGKREERIEKNKYTVVQ